ncbi:SufE family protein [Marinomonas sp. THO17]|uniref:SufE family protein n=1 Tax=Marinomonas sp. THO17 TaxID=3149048 RepID=UPI00336BE4B0
MTDSNNQTSIKAKLQACRSREDTFKTLVDLSKSLIRLSPEDKTEENKIKGCESAVWLIENKQDGVCHFRADSDAKLMRGVLVALLSLVNGKSKEDIQAMDLANALTELNLGSYLTSSRSNGVLAILDRIIAN